MSVWLVALWRSWTSALTFVVCGDEVGWVITAFSLRVSVVQLHTVSGGACSYTTAIGLQAIE